MILILCPLDSNAASACDTEIPRWVSSGSKSVVVVPSSTRPWRLIAPALNRSASANVVLPEPPCPTSATFRIRAGGKLCIGTPRFPAPPGPFRVARPGGPHIRETTAPCTVFAHATTSYPPRSRGLREGDGWTGDRRVARPQRRGRRREADGPPGGAWHPGASVSGPGCRRSQDQRGRTTTTRRSASARDA